MKMITADLMTAQNKFPFLIIFFRKKHEDNH